ncbi:GvpL/GvpF family gas vesicle protein [Streptomyces sp. XY006]|uniref:GvpL/GvpF family gas vesicle protein n=1 Tax=Streptomyces sp. XY006 TaxID=2021410 RepID=UPI000B8BCD7D|nr:hypothetical protein CHR28_10660 [Streptomyces sp. XY006]
MRLLTEAGLCAAVPDAPASVRARRRDLMAHQAVLGESAAQGPVLPVRFAVLTPEAEALRTRLRYDHAHLTAQLDGVRDCVEMNGPVRARPPYPAAPRLRGERPAGRGAGKGVAREARDAAHQIPARLAGLAVRTAQGPVRRRAGTEHVVPGAHRRRAALPRGRGGAGPRRR